MLNPGLELFEKSEPDVAALFLRLVDEVRTGRLAERAVDASSLSPLGPGDLLQLPAMDSTEYRVANRLGEEALRRGEVASLIVAGGAGTRFGGAAKALAEVAAGQTFLALKLAESARALRLWGRPLPVAVMTSHLTHDAIAVAVRESGLSDVLLFRQRSLPRLALDDTVWRDLQSAVSIAPP